MLHCTARCHSQGGGVDGAGREEGSAIGGPGGAVTPAAAAAGGGGVELAPTLCWRRCEDGCEVAPPMLVRDIAVVAVATAGLGAALRGRAPP